MLKSRGRGYGETAVAGQSLMPGIPTADAVRKPVLLYVVTEDWYFWLHRLALGQGALAAGYDVVVAARVQHHRARLEAAGFRVVALPWRRGGGTLRGELQTLLLLWRLCRTPRPEIVHLIALKPIIYGGFAARLAGVRARISTVAGLGYVFTSARLKARLLRPAVILALRFALGGRRGRVTLENPDDGRVLAVAGALAPRQVALICSCGVDCERFRPAPEPEGPLILGMASRLVRDKGAGIAVEAVRLVRAAGIAVRFRLAGAVDPDNPDSLSESELASWEAAGLVERLGHIDDVAAFWHGCHVAVYPSRYGEGLPKTLLEAAACGRPVITTNMPGCRDAIEDGVTGFLVEVDDAAGLAARITELAGDPELRARMGMAGRARTLVRFADPVVVGQMTALYRDAEDRV